jgi:N-acetyltransferase
MAEIFPRGYYPLPSEGKMTFDLQPTLTGDIVILRPLRLDDWDALYAAAADPLIWEQHPNSDRYKEEVFRDYFQGALDSGGGFAVLDAKDGRVIGSSRYACYDEANDEIEVGWTFLAREYWGGSYNGEMKRLMLQHAFKFVDTVIFLVGPNNLRSQKALAKIGAVRGEVRSNSRDPNSFLFEIKRSPSSEHRVSRPLR